MTCTPRLLAPADAATARLRIDVASGAIDALMSAAD